MFFQKPCDIEWKNWSSKWCSVVLSGACPHLFSVIKIDVEDDTQSVEDFFDVSSNNFMDGIALVDVNPTMQFKKKTSLDGQQLLWKALPSDQT